MGLEGFFNPASVAIVGASRTKGKVGYEILSALVRGGFEGEIFPVNPNADQVQGLKSYADLAGIGQVPELAIIVVPAPLVAAAMRQCAGLGVKSVVIISSGFKERGAEGAKLEREVMKIARSEGIRVVGPNCIGVMNPAAKLNASFAGELAGAGGIGYFSQSGSILAAIVDMATETGLGFSKLISIGNKADVDELEVMKALAADPETKVVAGYLETIADGDVFIRQAEKISREKPVLLMKSGVTPGGARAASSHTGRMVEEANAYRCVFERAGVIRCESIREQFDLARAFATGRYPAGPGVAVVANAGGAGIMATDAVEREGLVLAKLSQETISKLSTDISEAANVNNPIDLLGDALAERYETAIRTVLADDNVNSVLVLLSPHAMTECVQTAQAVVKVAGETSDKPILASFLGAGRIREAIEVLRQGGIPQYDSPESAVAAIKAMSNYAMWRSRPRRVVKLFAVNRRKVERIIERNLKAGTLELDETQTKEVLRAYGFVTPEGQVATSADQAASIAGQLGYPVTLKVSSPQIIQKQQVGGVMTNLNDDQAVRDAFDLMMYRVGKTRPEANIVGIVVEKMCSQGQEVMLGMTRDPRFGALMMFGAGGRMMEVLEDVVFYPAPLTADEAKEMLMRTRTYELLKGAEGQEAVDIDTIAEGLQRLSQLVTEFARIKEMDINPFIVGRRGRTPVVVDATMRLEG